MHEQKPSRGSEVLTERLKPHGAQAALSKRHGWRQDRISRWASGWRTPDSVVARIMEDELQILSRLWGEPPTGEPVPFVEWRTEKEISGETGEADEHKGAA